MKTRDLVIYVVVGLLIAIAAKSMGEQSAREYLIPLVAFAVGLLVYLTPWIVAVSRKHKSTTSIAVLTILSGWTVLGWVGALAWSLTNQAEHRTA